MTIVLSILLFLVLGGVQIMMVAHGRVMTEYAAYCAARAGIVHNGDWNVMRNAALMASLPVYQRTDTPDRFVVAWAKVKAAAEITEAVDTGTATLERLAGDLLGIELSGLAQDVSLVEVRVTSPSAKAFERSRQWQAERRDDALSSRGDAQGPLAYPDDSREIDFDDPALMAALGEDARLGVEVRVLYPLRIPIVSKIIFELYLAQVMLGAREVEGDLSDWARFRGKIVGGRNDGEYLDEAVAEAEGEGPLDDFFTTSQWSKELRTLRWVAERYGLYLLPLRASYAMPLQSNAFQKNRREPVWFTLEDF